MKNKTILQNFEWYLPNDGQHWNLTAERAAYLESLGFTDVWMPPAYKGIKGIHEVGYGVYDHYDLGEFFQKGTVRTKYGTKDEYLAAIKALQAHNMHVLGDIVLNHRMGGDDMEEVTVNQMYDKNRLTVKVENKHAKVETVFSFPGRGGIYSDFTWNKNHFNAVDRNFLNDPAGAKGILKILPKVFNPNVDDEYVNFDYLMGCNHALDKPEVREELIRWGKWYMDFTGLDGVRLDALKHMDFTFYTEWLYLIREHLKSDVFAVGEYWSGNVVKLREYLENCCHCMTLFDAPLHYRFYHLSTHNMHRTREEGYITMQNLLQETLVDQEPKYAVTFVDNHDTHESQDLRSWVLEWFKPMAYAIILLRKEGIPCVFYGDLFGIPSFSVPPVDKLDILIKARQRFAYGEQKDYFDHPNTVGWTRRGSLAGDMAVLMTDGDFGWKDMELGKPGEVYVDLLGNRQDEITIGADGKGHFTVNPGSLSVWVRKDQAYV